MGYVRDPENNGPPLTTDIAIGWLSAVTDGRAVAVRPLMSFPFSYREAGAAARCSRTVDKPDAVGALVDCIHARESGLIEAMRLARTQPRRLHLAPGTSGAGKKLKGLAGNAGRKHTWVSGSLEGNGVKYDLLLAVSGNDETGRRVAAVFIASSVQPR